MKATATKTHQQEIKSKIQQLFHGLFRCLMLLLIFHRVGKNDLLYQEGEVWGLFSKALFEKMP